MLSEYLDGEIYGYFLILVRIAAILALMPGLGESNIPAQARIALALLIALVLQPMIGPLLPAKPATVSAFAFLLVHEIVIGLFIGLIGRIFLSALNLAGTVIAFQSGLAAAQNFDPTQGSQSATMARFMTVLGVTAIFAFDLHHGMIRAMAGSYAVFTPQAPLIVADAARLMIDLGAQSFLLGVQISAPFLIYGLLFNIALGLVARLMPQIQVFFIAMPANIMLSFMIFMFTSSAMMLWFLDRFEAQFALFLP